MLGELDIADGVLGWVHARYLLVVRLDVVSDVVLHRAVMIIVDFRLRLLHGALRGYHSPVFA